MELAAKKRRGWEMPNRMLLKALALSRVVAAPLLWGAADADHAKAGSQAR
jgi:hypothetical protein